MKNRTLEVDVTALGAGGDGLAETAEGRLFVPYAAPGDRLLVQVPEKPANPLRGKIVERLTDGATRQEPLCSHFSTCGGCAVQHIDATAYAAWKRDLVRDALSHRGIDPDVVADMVPGGVGRRRRARFHARSTARGAIVGYRTARSHHIVPVRECPVLMPEMVAFLEPLRQALTNILSRGQEAEIAITRCDTGLDVTFAMGKALPFVLREKLIAVAEDNDLVRVSWQPLQRGTTGELETVIRRLPATVTYDGIKVDIPADAFIQATAEGESALRDAVLAAVAGSKRVVDLYAGCGAFSLPVAAQGSHVLAVDSMANQMAALDHAARRTALGEFVTTDRRDLNRRPLMVAELNGIDAVILDPPRAGAQVQAGLLAEASVPTLVYVSCNPASFARDARMLIDGGYELQSVTPVDQFLFSPHTELVAVFLKQV